MGYIIVSSKLVCVCVIDACPVTIGLNFKVHAIFDYVTLSRYIVYSYRYLPLFTAGIKLVWLFTIYRSRSICFERNLEDTVF